jgi:hypothetical protein
MKATRCLLVLAAVAALCTGCVAWKAPVVPPSGAIYTHYKAPLTLNDQPAPLCEKSGKSSTSYLALFYPAYSVAWADAAIETAAKEGGLQKVHYADYEVLSVLGIYAEFTVRVYGE